MAVLLLDSDVVDALAAQIGCTASEANAKLQAAARDLPGSVTQESLPELTIRLVAARWIAEGDPAERHERFAAVRQTMENPQRSR